MLTLNQITEKLKAFFTAHHFVNRVTFGVNETFTNDKEPLYPHVHFQVASINPGQPFVLSFQFMIEDLPSTIEDKPVKIQQIHSDTLQTIQDFIGYAQSGQDFWDSYDIDLSIASIDPFYDGETQLTAGYVMDFALGQHNDYDICNIPIGPAIPVPPASCLPAEIVDVDGNVLQEVASGGTFCLKSFRMLNSSGNTVYVFVINGLAVNGISVSAFSLLDAMTAVSVNSFEAVKEATAEDIDNGATGTFRGFLQALLCSPCSDATVTVNSSAFDTVASGGTLDVPVEYVNGSAVGSLVTGVWTIPNPATPSGVYYRRPVYNQYNSYDNAGSIDNAASSYDEGWHLRNGNYDYTPPVYPATFAALDFTSTDPFVTLAENNVAGNTNRFTAADGTQTYPDVYVVDHLTGLGYWANEANSNNKAWDVHLAYTNTATEGGYSDWRMCTNEELNMIFSENSTGFQAPFNNIGTGSIWSATTFPESLTDAYVTFATKAWSRNQKSLNRALIMVRNHYT